MDSIYQQAKQRKFAEKTDKSFNNILMGFRSHQTYFDAMMQGQLPFYNSRPELTGDTPEDIRFYPYFYDASHMTFQALRLLTQTMAAQSYQIKDFYPVSNHLFIQHQVKSWLHSYKRQPKEYETELLSLYDKMAQELPVFTYKLLPDAKGNHFSIEEICRASGFEQTEYSLMLLRELNLLTHLIHQHDYFKSLYIRMPLHSATEQTKEWITKGIALDTIALKRGVKLHTIEDHIIEMIIKDYPVDVSRYVTETEIAEIRSLYHQHHYQRLKPYFEESQIDSYFKVKIALCLIMKEVKL
ncbi:helix-turn-helix domain-containing protein [Macrococcus brunensis]|uniref:helix-turn-helix domain-containing protein n=1 Tax=Macrococcus brunensis TaxID=198483 RepID=UPI001EEFC73E|nr:helix-turn-helix domain-containing protein [Macrococcus brunensis]ULG71040.1 helix-turn-helix domain-containing protein [Macrococcus brunensis]